MTISPPAALTRSTVSVTLSRSRSTAKIFAPSSAKRTAMARPLPQPGPMQPAPVTIVMRSRKRPPMLCPSGQFTRRSETIEALRIVGQHRLACGLAGRDLAENIDQNPVIGRRSLMIGMRPVGAPDAAVAEFGHQSARKWRGIGVGRSLPGHAVGAADFHPDIIVIEQREQRLEGRLLQPER